MVTHMAERIELVNIGPRQRQLRRVLGGHP